MTLASLFESYSAFAKSYPTGWTPENSRQRETVIEASLRLRTLRKRPILGIGGCQAFRFQAQTIIQRGNTV